MSAVVYRDAVTRIGIAQIRASFAPREWRQKEAVTLEAAGVRVTVPIVQLPCPTAKGGTRRWILCPNCTRPTSVIGLVSLTWSCSRRDCGAWRSRKLCRKAA